MSCERFHAALAAHAAGGDLDAATARHLGDCAACRALLEAQHGVLAELDAELGRTLSIAASPDFVARIAQATSETRSHSPRWGFPAPLLAGLGVAAVVLLAVWVRQPVVQDQGPAAAFRPFDKLRGVPSTVEGRLKAEATQPVERSTARATPPSTARVASAGVASTPVASGRVPPVRVPPARVASGFSRKAVAQSDPPVIVEASRALALQRLRELNAQGRLDGKALPPAVTPETALAELTVAPLAVADISIPDVEIVNRPPTAPQRQ